MYLYIAVSLYICVFLYREKYNFYMVESMCGSISRFIYLLCYKYFPMSIRMIL